MKKHSSGKPEAKLQQKNHIESSGESECDDSYVPRFMNSRRRRLQVKIGQEES
jgi:hypothetical protein